MEATCLLGEWSQNEVLPKVECEKFAVESLSLSLACLTCSLCFSLLPLNQFLLP